jgi:hypothetical protein
MSAGRKDVGVILETAGYDLQERLLADHEATIAATAYALVACIELDGPEELTKQVSDVQAEFTQLAREAPSARSWDLYLVFLLSRGAEEEDQRSSIEAIESDTTYARKFVYAELAGEDLDQALRPLLPLRPAADLEIDDPITELRKELLAIGVAKQTVDEAIISFENKNEVTLR